LSAIIRSSRTQTVIITIMLVGLLILSGFTWTQYNDLKKQSTALETKNAEIESLNQRIRELSIFEKLVNLSRPPDLYRIVEGVQIVKSYPMEFNYNYPDTYDPFRSIITLYVPKNGSVVSLNLFISLFTRFPVKLMLQRGNAWINQTWVRLGTSAELYGVNSTNVYWQSPVIWSSNFTESGLYYTPQLGEGWYTLCMFEPILCYTNINTPYGLACIPPIVHDYIFRERSKVDSLRVTIHVSVLNEGVQGFFAASCDWYM
jgi:hypothetical protein